MDLAVRLFTQIVFAVPHPTSQVALDVLSLLALKTFSAGRPDEGSE